MTVFYVGKRVFCMWTKRLPILSFLAMADGGKIPVFCAFFLMLGSGCKNHWAVPGPKEQINMPWYRGIREQHRVQPFFPGDDLIRGPAQDEYSSYEEYLYR